MIKAELFLPDKYWMLDIKEALKEPKILAALAAAGIIGAGVSPILPIVPPLYYLIIVGLIKWYSGRQVRKRISAVQDSFDGKYTEKQLEELAAKNPKELKRLFKLSSDEFFKNYIQEQTEHRKAQNLIKTQQQRIDGMRSMLTKIMQKDEKNKERITQLTDEIAIYEDVLTGWRKEDEQKEDDQKEDE